MLLATITKNQEEQLSDTRKSQNPRRKPTRVAMVRIKVGALIGQNKNLSPS